MSENVYMKDALQIAMKVGNVKTALNTNVEVLDLNEQSQEAQRQHAMVLQQYEAQKRARSIVVPTSVDEVKQKLRELGKPVTLFGEDNADRRERLKETIANLQLGEEELSKLQAIINQSSTSSSAAAAVSAVQPERTKQKEIFYSNASDALIQSRKRISEYSFEVTHTRILRTKSIRENESLQAQEDEETLKSYAHCKDMVLNSSQIGDERPLTTIRYSTDGSHLATGSLSCMVKAWDIRSLSPVLIGRGHEERITSVSWNPNTSSGLFFASSSADKTCKLWSLPSNNAMDESEKEIAVKSVQTLHGHTGVVTSCEFHPTGNFIGTSSSDFTWRLWNPETGVELQLQDGHTKECCVMAFHPDGSLAMTGDSAGLVLVWDLRSGQNIQVFQGHIKKIVSANWNSNGFQAATCGVDNQVRIWDLRKRKCSYILPAHSNAITDVRFSKSGELLTTSSFDGSVKIFGTRDYRLLNTMTGHLGKVMSCDFCPDERHIASAGYDRTYKLWAHKNEF